ncbi:T9SS type A sorting domain-containing protein, partial [bacterium]|nr:T9SS type A sorting domain-containing protein [bacterium]
YHIKTKHEVTQLYFDPENRILKHVDAVVLTDDRESLPHEYRLHQNFPNPFNSGTLVSFTLTNKSTLSLNIYSLKGEKVKPIFVENNFGPGHYEMRWDGTNLNGEALASGIYFYRLTDMETHQSVAKKMLLIR